MNKKGFKPRGLVGLVLAGGESRRYGSPKALARIGGETFLEKAYSKVSRATGYACIVLRDPSGDLLDLSRSISDCIVYDRNLPCQGPLRGLASSLKAVQAGYYLYVPVDYPLLEASTLENLASFVIDGGFLGGTVLLWSGYLASSIGVLSRGALGFVDRICSVKGRRAGLSDLYRVRGMALVGWSVVASSPAEFSNVNRPGEFAGEDAPRIDDIVRIDHGFFVDALRYWESDPSRARRFLVREASYYRSRGLGLLYKRVIGDLAVVLDGTS
ncbi:MAG: NTP transferase domain-containing protein [Desulfurococcales archaeon]|nr:NTP transferase domain-containing protein [Desulfurococcales archaeon]